MSSFGVVLDACVLYPAALVDLLLRAATRGLYRPYWSADILQELERNLAKRVGADGAAQRVAVMRQHFGEAEITGYQMLVPAMTNDPKDRHVVAVAVQAGAQVIVTDNIRDFPEAALLPHGLEAQTADAFLLQLHDLQPKMMAQLVHFQAAALRRPPMTFAEVLGQLGKQAPQFAARLQPGGGQYSEGDW
jgi:predicted nucleic acid-binding protein